MLWGQGWLQTIFPKTLRALKRNSFVVSNLTGSAACFPIRAWERVRFRLARLWPTSGLPTTRWATRWADHSGCQAGAQWDVSIAQWSIYS